eukprot:g15112.t1
MATFCESWDSNWMDGSCTGFDENLDDHADADAFEAALEPLPAWDGVEYSAVGGNRRSKKHATTTPPRRQHDWVDSNPHTFKEDHGKILHSLDLQTLSVDHHEGAGGDITGADSSVLRKSMLAGTIDVEVGKPHRSWSARPPGPKQQGSSSEPGRTLTHVIRLHRTGSVVVERTASPRPPGAGTAAVAAPESGQPDGEHGGFYAEEERFWRERCPPAEPETADRRDKETTAAVAVQRRIPPPSSPPGDEVAVSRAANYDYHSAEAAYRSSPRPQAAADPPYSNRENDGFVRVGRGASTTPSSQRRPSLDTQGGGGGFRDADHPPHPNPQPSRPPPRQVLRDGRGGSAAESGRNSRSRSRSLRDAEVILQGVLESVEGGLTTIEDPSPSRRTPGEDQVSKLRQGVAEPCSGERDTHKHHNHGGSPSPVTTNYEVRRHSENTANNGDNNAPSPSSGSHSPFSVPPERARAKGTTMRDFSSRQEYHDERGSMEAGEKGDESAEESAVRVAELSRRIALRCHHLEQECSRRERSQTRLFQEQLRGVRQAAQQVARRTIRDERARANQLLVETQKKFGERELAALAKFQQAEDGWKAERETLTANLATAKSELERARRLAREAAEAGRQDADCALEKQRLDLQRAWAEEKGGLRRAAEDALRRVVDAKTRAEEEAAQQAQTTQDSLNAQVRSWKAKAEAAEKRASEERDKRRRLEAGAKGALAQEVEKARESQEGIIRQLRAKSEADRAAHLEQLERIQEEHRAHILRVHQDKKRLSEAARRQWEQEMEEVRADAAARIEDGAARSAAERAEALRRLRLAHDVEMRKAGRDILRLEREVRRCQQQEPAGVVSRAKKGGSSLSPLPPGAYNPKPLPEEAAAGTSCLDGVEAEGGFQGLSSPGFGSSKSAENRADSLRRVGNAVTTSESSENDRYSCGDEALAKPIARWSQARVARGGNGALEMSKHRQNKGTKKHVKNRPRKSRLSDRNRAPTSYSIEVNTNGNFPGAPPVFELESEPEEGIDTKASVIEALASAEWDAEQAAKPAVDESKEMEVVMGGPWKA